MIKLRLLTTIFAAAVFIALAGCANQRDVQFLQGDMDEVKSRLFRMEKEIGGLKTETKGSVETSQKSVQTDIAGIRKGMADLQNSLEGTRVDLQVLSGKVDDAGQAAKRPAEDVALLKEDMRLRLAALEEKVQKLEKGVDLLGKQLAESKAKEPEKSPETLYQQGLDSFKIGSMAKARELFARFVELYPKHELAANAHYWSGETYYSEKKYDEAILEFEKVIRDYPGKDKVPAAMLKQGLAFREIGDSKSARHVLKKLVESYPTAEEAAKAKEKLKELK